MAYIDAYTKKLILETNDVLMDTYTADNKIYYQIFTDICYDSNHNTMRHYILTDSNDRSQLAAYTEITSIPINYTYPTRLVSATKHYLSYAHLTLAHVFVRAISV